MVVGYGTHEIFAEFLGDFWAKVSALRLFLDVVFGFGREKVGGSMTIHGGSLSFFGFFRFNFFSPPGFGVFVSLLLLPASPPLHLYF